MQHPDHRWFLWLCAALALMGIGFLTPRAGAQFQPPEGFIDIAVIFSTSAELTHEGEAGTYTLTRETFNNGETVEYTVDRPAPLDDVLFVREAFLSAGPGGSFIVQASFIGDHGLLFKVVDANSTTISLDAFFLDLSQPDPLEQPLFTQHPGDYSDFDNPNAQFERNGDIDDLSTATCFFTHVRLNTNSNPDTFELSVFRTDTGANICGADQQNSQASDQFTAEIADDNPPAGADTVFIRRNNTTLESCLLPVGNLVVTPQPLAFGNVQNNQTSDRLVTFSNSGQDSIQVTALSASAHFAPVNFTAFTLQPGGSIQRTIRFTPGGANGPFNENLNITRIPPVGAAVVNCTGAGTPPPPNLTVTPQPLAFGQVVNNVTADRVVTFANPGGGPVQVTALGASIHFAPVGFTGFTLQPGQTAQRTIRFTPGGANGPFNENLAITRNPAVGAAVVNCTGSGTSPTVTVQALTCCVNELTFPPGAVVNAFRLTRTGSTAANLTVNVVTGGTATASLLVGTPNAGADYLRLPAAFTIPVNSTNVLIPIVPINDTIDEPAQSVALVVQAGAGYLPGTPNTATINIIDNDPSPVITIVGRSFSEGFTNSTKVVADVRLSARSEFNVSVNWNTFTGFIPGQVVGSFITSTATPGVSCLASSGSDFVTSSGTLTWPANTSVLAQTISVPICGNLVPEGNDRFFVGLSSISNATLGSSTGLTPGQAVAAILNDDLNIGTFELTPDNATVAAHDPITYALTWTVPEPLNWHDLHLLQLRIRDDEGTAISVLWDEAGNSFSLINPMNGQQGNAFPPGSHRRLHTPQATLHLAETSVVGSGPTGPSVTLNLSLTLKPHAAGHTFTVEVAASDDLGNADDFTQAGTLTVTP